GAGWRRAVLRPKAALRVVRHHPAGPGRAPHDPRRQRLHHAGALRAALPVRDVDHAASPPFGLRGQRLRGAAGPRAHAPRVPRAHEPPAQRPPVQLHAAHGAPPRLAARVLPLAPRDHPQPDQGRGLRMGERLLHQPAVAGGQRRPPARSDPVTGWRSSARRSSPSGTTSLPAATPSSTTGIPASTSPSAWRYRASSVAAATSPSPAVRPTSPSTRPRAWRPSAAGPTSRG